MGKLLLVTGPSGVGKTTLQDQLVALNRCTLAISTTTREPRIGEINGVHYHFVTSEDFEEGIEQGEFVEHVQVHDQLYGVTESEAQRIFGGQQDGVLVADPQGAILFKNMTRENTFSIWLEPANWQDLFQRMLDRGMTRFSATQRQIKEREWGSYAYDMRLRVTDPAKLTEIVCASMGWQRLSSAERAKCMARVYGEKK